MKIFITLGTLLLLTGIGYFLFAPPEEIEPKIDTDTGYTRHETEELMRTIGYVQ